MRRLLTLLACLALAFAAFAPSASAAKPSTDLTVSGELVYGGTAVVDVATNFDGAAVVVGLVCSVDGEAVLSAAGRNVLIYGNPTTFTLASSTWTSGPANCTATAYGTRSNGTERVLGSVAFNVSG
jgi:hypothetical protein